jgi:hypothetical protein
MQRERTLKPSIRHLLLVTTTTLTLVAAYFAAEFYHRHSLEKELSNLLSSVSIPLLENGNPIPLFENMYEGSPPSNPDMAFIPRFLPLVVLEPFAGNSTITPLLSLEASTATLSSRAHYAMGTADIKTQLIHSEGRWQFTDYRVVAGPGVQ